MLSPSIIAPESKVNAAITDVLKQLYPDVQRIFFNFGPDWSGDPAVFFRIIISDEAARMRLRETMAKVVGMLESILNLETMGLHVYHNVRSESEQAALGEESW